MAGKNSKGRETSYARSQRRKAEKIVAADGCYSQSFRDEVQAALDAAPWKLPVLFREAARMDERRETAGRSIRAGLRKAGIPINDPAPRALARSPKRGLARDAEMIESLFVQDARGDLDDEWSGRASLVSDILFELSNVVGIDATHPALVKGYLLAIDAKWAEIDREGVLSVVRGMAQIRDLMNACSQSRLEEIDAEYQPALYGFGSSAEAREYYDSRTPFERRQEIDSLREARKAQADIVTERGDRESQVVAVDSDALVAKRQQLGELELVPENEAIRFQLESEIFKLEHESGADDEWPDVIGGDPCGI